MPDTLLKFKNMLTKNGIVGYSHDDVQYLWNVAKICARTNGVATAGAVAVMTAGVGTVALPGVGAVPGWVAGALAGFVSGTTTCVMGRVAFKRGLDEILADEP